MWGRAQTERQSRHLNQLPVGELKSHELPVVWVDRNAVVTVLQVERHHPIAFVHHSLQFAESLEASRELPAKRVQMTQVDHKAPLSAGFGN
jgi:hypothetical protein